MKKRLLLGVALFAIALMNVSVSFAQRGYHTAPYSRFEADAGTLSAGATVVSSYEQSNVAFEASDRTCVSMKTGGAVEWTINKQFKGIVLRYSIDGVVNHFDNVTAKVKLYVNNTYITTLDVNTYWSWEDLKNNGNVNNAGISNTNWRMRFDEVRYLLSSSYPSGTKIKLERESGNLYVDFIEVEDVSAAIACPSGYTQYNGDGSNLQSFLDSNGGNIYIPAGTINVPGSLNIGQNRTIQGAGMWYTTINFTSTTTNSGGIWSYFNNNLKDLSLRTSQRSRSNAYKGINGPWGNTSVIENVWVEHFECGAWIANYSAGYGNANADGLIIRNSRFRNNYADGINFCKGSRNCLVEYCSFRNNGDDDMAVWPADGAQCYNNTFRYCTAENCYRASSCALYGGYGNKWQNIIVKDNYEVGIRINGKFQGACFGDGAANEFSNIDVIGCGVWQNTYNNPEPAVDITTASNCNNVKNVKLSCINIKNSKADAIQLRNDGGYQISNVSLEGVSVEKTSRYGVTYNSGWGSSAGIRFVNNPTLNNVQYCNLSFSDVEGEDIVAYGLPTSGWTQKSSGCTTCTVVAVTGVNLDQTTKTLATGSSFTLVATVAPTNAANKNVSWSSNNNAVASVTSAGVVTGNAAGTATITVTTQDGSKIATCVVTVQNVAVTGVSVSPTTQSIGVGQNFTLTPTISPANATNKNVSWSSNNNAVATVNTSGVVTGVAAGTATITVTTQDGSRTATCAVTVKPSVSIVASTPNAYEGGAAGVFTISTPSTSSNITVNYTVSGSASSADYTANPTLSGSIILTAASPSKTITITAIDDTNYEGAETLILTLSSNAAYELGTASATMTIVDNDAPTCSGPVILYTATAPVIDGNIDAVWNNTVATYATRRVLDQNSGNVTGFGAKWRALYDASKLYLLIEVVKPTAHAGFYSYQSTTNDWWQGSDAVELFFDNGGIRQYIFIHDGTIKVSGTGASTTGLSSQINSMPASRTYFLEVSIPWSQLSVTPADNATLKMDVGIDVSKEASATGRIAQYTTFTTHDHAFNDASTYGTVSMKVCGNVITDVDDVLSSGPKIISYDDIIKVTGLFEGQIVSVYNSLGVKIQSVVALDDVVYISSLNDGIYVVSIEGTKVTEKVFVNK